VEHPVPLAEGNEEADIQATPDSLPGEVGREAEANDLFADAFEADPFNVRALNMMKVLEHLAQYEAIETEHYSILVLPGQDKLLGKYMARFLEAAWEGANAQLIQGRDDQSEDELRDLFRLILLQDSNELTGGTTAATPRGGERV